MFAQICVQGTGVLRNLTAASVKDAMEAPLVTALRAPGYGPLSIPQGTHA